MERLEFFALRALAHSLFPIPCATLFFQLGFAEPIRRDDREQPNLEQTDLSLRVPDVDQAYLTLRLSLPSPYLGQIELHCPQKVLRALAERLEDVGLCADAPRLQLILQKRRPSVPLELLVKLLRDLGKRCGFSGWLLRPCVCVRRRARGKW